MTFRWFLVLTVPVCLFAFLPAGAVVEQAAPAKRHLQVVSDLPAGAAETLDLTQDSPLAAAARAFRDREGGAWEFRSDPRTGRVSLVQGSGIPFVPGRGNRLDPSVVAGLEVDEHGAVTPRSLDPRVRAFLSENASLLLPARGSLTLDPESSLSRSRGRLISLYYDWLVDGIPVEGAKVFVRINSGNITQFGAPLIGAIDLSTTPRLSAEEALRTLLTYSGDLETAQIQDEPRLVIQPEAGAPSGLAYRLVWRFSYRLSGRIELWEGRVDALSGAVVGFRDLNAYARAVAGIYKRTVFTDPEIVVPLPFLDVTTPGGNVTTDAAGFYSYGGGSVSSTMGGAWFDTNCQGCTNPTQPLDTASSGIGRLDFGLGGNDQVGNGFSTPADRNTFYHLNQVRRVALKWLPSMSFLFNTSFTSNVNITSTCNAVFSGNSVNFFRSGNGCNNTGEVADVVHHEYGHGIDLNSQGGDGATGEATADIVATHMTHSPLIGPGFRTDGSPVRNVDATTSDEGTVSVGNVSSVCPVGQTQGPLGRQVHCEGLILGQTSWELSTALVGRYGHHTGWRTSEQIFYESLPDAGGYLANDSMPVYDAYINADDDDGNLFNGTPNALEIFTAFDAHGIANAQVPSSTACTRPAQPVLTLTPQCSQFDLSWTSVGGADQYVVFRSELIEDSAYLVVAELSSAQTTYSDTEVAPNMDYYYYVMAVDGAGCESTVENPQAGNLPDQPLLSVSAIDSSDEPMGNRSGFADPGEQVDLTLTLQNVGAFDSTGVSGQLASSTPGVSIVLGSSGWPDLDAGEAAQNDSALRFETDDQVVSCGDVIDFQLVPDDSLGCPGAPSIFSVQIGEADGGGGFVCDSTPACFLEPSFSGLQSAGSGSSCGEIDLTWLAATSNCVNAEIRYNVYRNTDSGFVPGPGTLVHEGLSTTAWTDFGLEPGETYHYVVRADDSRSGEDANNVELSVVSPVSPDVAGPAFAGLGTAGPGVRCGETELSWQPAIESCNAPVAYDIHRSTDPGFTPGPETLLATTFSTSLVDAGGVPNVSYTYLVRARDGIGNTDANEIRQTLIPGARDLQASYTGFEPDDDQWTVIAPDDASAGNWQWGDPVGTQYQPEFDATPSPGTRCWITGLSSQPSNGDVDGGTTTLLSRQFDMSSMVNPLVAYSRWFTNDRGASPGDPTDGFRIDVSNDDGQSWTPLEPEIGAGTPLAWVPVQRPLPIAATDEMRFRFQTADLGDGSLVEAGIDEFELIDVGQGCDDCFFPPPNNLCEISVDLAVSGDDVVLSWPGSPIGDSRVVVYDVRGCDDRVLIGTVDGGTTFVHEGAALSSEPFSYRVTFVDNCGTERPFCGQTDCP